MTRVLWCSTFVAMLAVAGMGTRNVTSASANGNRSFRDAASSKEELARWLLEALERKDLKALRRLRVTEAEYKDFILPGSVEVGQPPRTYPPNIADYAWKTLNTKSLYYERYLLTQVGGKHMEYKDMSFAKGIADYATYRAYRQLRLAVIENGSPAELATGSIIEVGGKCKFISYIRD